MISLHADLTYGLWFPDTGPHMLILVICGNTAYGVILFKSSFPSDIITKKEVIAAPDG